VNNNIINEFTSELSGDKQATAIFKMGKQCIRLVDAY